MNYQAIDEQTVQRAKNYLREEAAILENLSLMHRSGAFDKLGYSGVWQYCVKRLNLSEATASAMSSIIAKSQEVPKLRDAVTQGVLSVSQAKRITRVIKASTAEQWIHLAATENQKSLEKAVALELPEPPPSSHIKAVGGTMSELKLVVPEEIRKKFERLMEVRGADAIKALDYALTETLKRHDPLEKAKRNIGKPAPRSSRNESGLRLVRSHARHQVTLRDEARCIARLPDGSRCENRRWLHIHHKTPVSMGGSNEASNLTLLCSSHHRQHHRKETGPAISARR